MVDNNISKNEKIFAALSYIWVLCLIPVFWGKRSPFVEFHSRQGLVLLVSWLVVSLLSWVPFVGQLAVFALIVISVIGVIKTMKGEEWEIPLLGKYAKQIKI